MVDAQARPKFGNMAKLGPCLRGRSLFFSYPNMREASELSAWNVSNGSLVENDFHRLRTTQNFPHPRRHPLHKRRHLLPLAHRHQLVPARLNLPRLIEVGYGCYANRF